MGARPRPEPIYETLEGWSGSTRGARSYAELPAAAVKYVRRIEELVEAPVVLLSPARNGTTRSHCAIPSPGRANSVRVESPGRSNLLAKTKVWSGLN